jgi:RNA polymerase sigma-70 factor (ECF subfamily)
MAVMTADLIERARAGDGDAFRELTDPYRPELLAHCYRMLGSLHSAEDALQETLLAAWQGLAAFERRAAVRTWLYRIATNRCLNALRSARRRPAQAWDVPGFDPPEPTRLGEIAWLEPYPGSPPADAAPGPDARYEQTESISLAFVTALQHLPPRQLAVLVLRDVLGFRASETAELLDSTVTAVNSSLKRARASLERRAPSQGDDGRPPGAGSAAEAATVARFVSAYEAGDVRRLVALLTADVSMSMPPYPLEYQGRAAVADFLARMFGAGRMFDLVPTRANGQPAFGAYLRRADGDRPGVGLVVLTLADQRIRALDRFDRSVLRRFGLPPTLAGPR